jgi:flagellar biosynthesis/type III secretory pathway protein FliH
MSDFITVRLSRPITSLHVLEDYPASVRGGQADVRSEPAPRPSPDLEAQEAVLSQTCQALNNAAAKLNEFYDKLLVEHKEEIAKLSIEIARRILVHKVENGDYEIQSIIKEALQNAPSRHDVIVHLHPEDFAQCQKVLHQEEQDGAFDGIQFVSDWSVGRAECFLETPKGIIKSLIDENLERIGQALQKA